MGNSVYFGLFIGCHNNGVWPRGDDAAVDLSGDHARAGASAAGLSAHSAGRRGTGQGQRRQVSNRWLWTLFTVDRSMAVSYGPVSVGYDHVDGSVPVGYGQC